MAKTVKHVTYNHNDREIVALLKASEDGLTLSEISEALGRKVNPGTITSVRSKGLIADIGERDIERNGFKHVATYLFVNSEVAKRENGKAYNYSETEMKILEALASFEAPVTLTQIAEKMGIEKLTSGNINALVKKGNVAKGDDIKVACKIPATVKVYGFVMDIPTNK